MKWLADSIENAIDVASDILDCEVDKEKISKLIADGLTVATIASLTGYSAEIIERLLGEEND